MKLKEASRTYGIPLYVLKDLVNKELIREPVSTSSAIGLALLGRVCQNDVVLKWMMSKRPVKKRIRLVRTAGLNRMESWIFSRYLDFKGKKLSVDHVAQELSRFFSVEINKTLIRTIYKCRKLAYNERNRLRRGGKK